MHKENPKNDAPEERAVTDPGGSDSGTSSPGKQVGEEDGMLTEHSPAHSGDKLSIEMEYADGSTGRDQHQYAEERHHPSPPEQAAPVPWDSPHFDPYVGSHPHFFLGQQNLPHQTHLLSMSPMPGTHGHGPDHGHGGSGPTGPSHEGSSGYSPGVGFSIHPASDTPAVGEQARHADIMAVTGHIRHRD